MRVLLVYNPYARLARRAPVAAIEAELRRLGADVEAACAQDHSEGEAAAQSAVAAGVERVIVAGGDGTVNAVLAPLAGAPVSLGVIPLGTGNVLAEEAGLRAGDWRTACRVALGPATVVMDLGRADGRFFAVMLGTGLDARVAKDIAGRDKASYGRLAFAGQFLRTLWRYRPVLFRVEVDGQALEDVAWAGVVSNTPRYAWRLHLCPHASPADGRLDLALILPVSRLRVLGEVGMCFLTGRGPMPSAVGREGFRRARIETDPPVEWQVDGDLAGQTPVEVEVVPGALRVAVSARGRLGRLAQT
ncbi:MAG: diacylglycerol kinase family protein [Armatimonadetes bacterium]|nr:diacylglycerol kinase family protein [Armatimonadota bacterium]